VKGGGPGLGARLLGAFALVLGAAAVTGWVVAAVVGPGLFHRHMVAAGVGEDHPAMVHAEQAFRDASTTSLTVAFAVAAVAALGLCLAITRRVGRSLESLAQAAARVAEGEFVRVESPALGPEFAALAEAFSEMAAELGEAEAERERSAALRDRLLADVAHELRTPVATLTAYLEAIEDGVTDLTPETMAILREQGERLTRLARDLVAVTRASNGEVALDLEYIHLDELLAAAAAAARPAFQASGVTLTVAEAPVEVVAVDRARLAQVLANLLDNAVRHTPSGGAVTLSARLKAAWVAIIVADTGDGIAPEHLPHVFERFYRVDTARDRAHGGSGIGLAIVEALTKAHGGGVAVASPGPGQGAVFTVTLPLAPPLPGPLPEAPPAPG
jgi:signal transduction histidine kinase